MPRLEECLCGKASSGVGFGCVSPAAARVLIGFGGGALCALSVLSSRRQPCGVAAFETSKQLSCGGQKDVADWEFCVSVEYEFYSWVVSL